MNAYHYETTGFATPVQHIVIGLMSNYQQMTKHPETGETVMADWLDDHFGHHRYGVRFPDGKVFRESEIESIEVNGIGADSSQDGTTVEHWDGSTESR